MVCPHCASTNIVSLKGQRFCVNCGRQLGAAKAAIPEAQAAVDAEVKKLMVKTGGVKPVPVKSADAKPPIKASSDESKRTSIISHLGRPVAATPPQAKPKASAHPIVSDIKPPSRPVAKVEAKVAPKPKPPKPAKVSKTKHHKTAAKPESVEAPQPVPQPHKSAEPAKMKRSRYLSRTSWILGAFVALPVACKVALISHTGATSPGGLARYMAYLPLASKEHILMLLPGVILASILLVILMIWLKNSLIFAGSRAYDHRPTGARVARLCGWNALGATLALVVLASIIGAGALIGLLILLKYTQNLPLASWVINVLGIAICFIWVLAALWFGSVVAMAYWTIVLSGQTLRRSIKAGLSLAKRYYTALAATSLGLGLITIGSIGFVTAALIALNRLRLPHRLISISLIAGLLTWMVAVGLIRLEVDVWTRRYRRYTDLAWGQGSLALYRAGRKPKPVSRWGVALTLIWWIIVAAGATWALGHWRFDPSNLLLKLAEAVY